MNRVNGTVIALSESVRQFQSEVGRLRGALVIVKENLLALAGGPLSPELLTMATVVDLALRPLTEADTEETIPAVPADAVDPIAIHIGMAAAAAPVASPCPRRCFCCFRRCTGEHRDGGCHVGPDRHFVAFENLSDDEADAARVAVALVRDPVGRKVLGE